MQNKELPERPAAVCRVNIESLSLPNPTKAKYQRYIVWMLSKEQL
jgi:hypothetical protein